MRSSPSSPCVCPGSSRSSGSHLLVLNNPDSRCSQAVVREPPPPPRGSGENDIDQAGGAHRQRARRELRATCPISCMVQLGLLSRPRSPLLTCSAHGSFILQPQVMNLRPCSSTVPATDGHHSLPNSWHVHHPGGREGTCCIWDHRSPTGRPPPSQHLHVACSLLQPQ